MPVIKVENLSKKYIIRHQKQGSYGTLVEKISQAGRSAYEHIRHPLSANREEVDLEEFWALKDINFKIDQGDRVGIIGRNGAGKTTLLKVLSRITEPTTGRITINGRVASLLEVGTGFHPELTGRENIFLNGAILGMGKAEIKKKFDEIVAFAEIEKFLDTPVKRYSSGMYVRLAFAVAAHLEPEILLVDEVLAVGDAAFQNKCLGKMEEVSNEGRTVLFVSHNMGAIQHLTKHCIQLSNGAIEYRGDTNKVVRNYLTSSNNRLRNRRSDNLKSGLDKFNVVSFAFDNSKLDIGFNKPLFFNLELFLDKDFTNIRMHFGIANMLGCRILTAKSFFKYIRKGHQLVTFRLTNHQLPAGNYSVDLYMRRLDEFFAQEKVIFFELPEMGIDDPFIIKRKDAMGVFHSPECTISEIE